MYQLGSHHIFPDFQNNIASTPISEADFLKIFMLRGAHNWLYQQKFVTLRSESISS